MKMFVLIRNDLKDTAYQAVQAGHAVAQFMIKYPESSWKNQTLVYVVVKNMWELEKWLFTLRSCNINHSRFIEPDLDDEITAVACVVEETDEGIFKSLNLLRGK